MGHRTVTFILLLSLCVSFALAQTNSTNVTDTTNTTSNVTNTTTDPTQELDNGLDKNSDLTQVTEPALVTNSILSLPFSPKQSIFIGSERLEAFQVITDGASTKFKVTYYNGKQTNSYEASLPGAWTHVKSTSKTLSCNVVQRDGTQIFAFLKFDISTTPPTLTQASTVTNPPITLSSAQIGTDCLRVKSSSNDIYRIGTDQLVLLSRPSGTVQAVNERLNYLIVDNVLYNFRAPGSWGSLRTLTSRSAFRIQSSGNRIVVYGSDAALNSTYTVIQDVYILAINTATNVVTTIFSETIDAKDSATDYVPVFVSPWLTKVFYQYTGAATSVVTYTVKSIQGTSNTLTDMSFQLESGFTSITSGLTYGSGNFYLGDTYLVVRSATQEEGFQFASNKIISVRKRDLGASEQNHACYRIMINQVINSQLAVVDLTLNSGTTPHQYDISEHLFGSLATNYQFTAPVSAAYFEFTEPTNTASSISSEEFFWVYVNAGVSTTTVTAQKFAPGQTNNRVEYSEDISGVWTTILARNPNCILLKKDTAEYLLLRNTGMTSSTSTQVDLTATITALSSAKTHFYLSDSCGMLSVDKTTIFRFNSSSGQYEAVSSAPQYNTADQSFTYLFVASTNSIWKYNSSPMQYTQYHTGLNAEFNTNTIMKSSGSRILLAVANSSPTLEVFTDSGSAFTREMSQTITGFASFKLAYAPDFSNLVVYGVDSSSVTKLQGYARTVSSTNVVAYELISLPTSIIVDATNLFMGVTATWLYVRQLANGVQAAGSNKEYIYAFSQSIFTLYVSDYTITASDEANWKTTHLSQTSGKDFYAYTQIQQSSATTISVNDLEALSSSVETTESVGEETGTVVVDGVVEMCLTGCNNCLSGTCTGCSDGYVLSSNLCYACGLNCKACSANNPQVCSSCLDGNYLSGSSCLACDSNCVTCSGAATTCTQCKPKKYWDGTACIACPRNCKTCTSSGCTKCRKGFALKSDGSACRSCSIFCSDCNADDITTCTACGRGLYLSGGQCLQCPDNCKLCNNGLCAKCIKGYHPNSAGQCVLNCEFPCASCQDNQPSNCTTCYRFSTLNPSTATCSADLACNADFSCTRCGAGYALVGAQCFECPVIPNCKQCSRTNLQDCAICEKGYYPNGDVCEQCPTGCRRCRSSQVCNSCIGGYTLISTSDDVTADEQNSLCQACIYPCKTCIGTTTSCKQCESGFTKKGWKCRNDRNVGFNIVLGASSIAQVMAILDDIVTKLLTLLNKPTNEVELIVFTTIVAGSVDVSGSYSQDTTTDSQVQQESTLLSSGLQGATIGGVAVTSSSVSANGITTTSDSDSSGSDTGLIIGLAVGIPIAVLIIIIVIFMVYRYKKKTTATEEELPVDVEKVREEVEMKEKEHVSDPIENVEFTGAPALPQDFKRFEMDLPNEEESLESSENAPVTSYPTQYGSTQKGLMPGMMAMQKALQPELVSVQSSVSRSSKVSGMAKKKKTESAFEEELVSDGKTSQPVSGGIAMNTLQPQLLELDLPSEDLGSASMEDSMASDMISIPPVPEIVQKPPPPSQTPPNVERYHVRNDIRQSKTSYPTQGVKSMDTGFPVMPPELRLPKSERDSVSESSSSSEDGGLEPEPIKVTVNPVATQAKKQEAPAFATPFMFQLDMSADEKPSEDSQSDQ